MMMARNDTHNIAKEDADLLDSFCSRDGWLAARGIDIECIRVGEGQYIDD